MVTPISILFHQHFVQHRSLFSYLQFPCSVNLIFALFNPHLNAITGTPPYCSSPTLSAGKSCLIEFWVKWRVGILLNSTSRPYAIVAYLVHPRQKGKLGRIFSLYLELTYFPSRPSVVLSNMWIATCGRDLACHYSGVQTDDNNRILFNASSLSLQMIWRHLAKLCWTAETTPSAD